MDTWSPLQVMLAILAAIFIPGILVHFTLGRNGGHHLFDKELPKGGAREIPFSMLAFRTRNNLIGSFVILVSAAFVIVIMNAICGALDIETSRDFWVITSIIAFFVLAFMRLLLLKKKY